MRVLVVYVAIPVDSAATEFRIGSRLLVRHIFVPFLPETRPQRANLARGSHYRWSLITFQPAITGSSSGR